MADTYLYSKHLTKIKIKGTLMREHTETKILGLETKMWFGRQSIW